MRQRGWHNERVMTVVDTTGRPTTVTTGYCRNADGLNVAVIGIGDGPSAVLTSGEIERLGSNLAQSKGDAFRANRRTERRKCR